VELEKELIPLIVAKKATKKNMLTDSKNIPPSVLLDGDNRHDKMFLRDS
jgi:hypothetical protein